MDEDNEEWLVDPSSMEMEQPQGQVLNYNRNWAAVIQLIQIRIQDTPIDEDTKKYLLKYIVPYVNLAGFTYIEKTQIVEFMIGYEILWNKYRIYMNPSNDPELVFLKSWIKEMFLLMINKSKEGMQLREVFETKSTYDIQQKKVDYGERIKQIFGRKKQRVVTEEVKSG